MILCFHSHFRTGGKSLYLFAKGPDDVRYTFLSPVSVAGADYVSALSPGAASRLVIEFELDSPLPSLEWSRFNWSREPVLVNRLALPPSFAALIATGRWKSSPHLTGARDIFAHAGNVPSFYAPDKMQAATSELYALFSKGDGKSYALASSRLEDHPVTEPSVLDIDSAICIGDTGPDEPFCLDFRWSRADARVVRLAGDETVCWEEVAFSLTTFEERLTQA